MEQKEQKIIIKEIKEKIKKRIIKIIKKKIKMKKKKMIGMVREKKGVERVEKEIK